MRNANTTILELRSFLFYFHTHTRESWKQSDNITLYTELDCLFYSIVSYIIYFDYIQEHTIQCSFKPNLWWLVVINIIFNGGRDEEFIGIGPVDWVLLGRLGVSETIIFLELELADWLFFLQVMFLPEALAYLHVL